MQSVLQVDKGVFSLVCEECAYEVEATATLGTRIRRKLTDLRINESDWVTCIRQIFAAYDDDNNGMLDRKEFLSFLANIDVFMTHDTYNVLWDCIDFDCSGVC